MIDKKDYGFGTLRLKKDTIEFLNELKEAYDDSYGTKFTMDEFFHKMAASIEDGDVSVWEIYCTKQIQKAELKEKIEESKKLRESKSE